MKAFIKLLTFNAVLFTAILFSNTIFAQTPNVIVIIADDMGWSEVSTGLTNLGNPSDFYETPTIATLAAEGIAFPHAYVNGANCAPTRAALLSGQYAARPTNQIFAVASLNRGGNSTMLIGPDMGLPSGIDELPVAAITLAETMQLAGYATVHLGKYHVGENENTNVTNNAATDQGFDRNYGGGTKGNPGSYFASSSAPYKFHTYIGPELDVYAAPYTLAESMELAGDSSLDGTPKHVTDAMYDAAEHFMDSINLEVEPFFMHFSNFAVHGPLGAGNSRPDLYAKYVAKKATNPSSMGHTNLGLAAIAEGMDQTIGRLIDYLKTTNDPRNVGHKLSENTLVYFISDNGGAINTEENGPLRGMKGDLYEGGIRSVTVVWSEASWLENKGTVNHTPIIGFDIYPTFVEAAGGTLPSSYDIDGVSHWQMLTNPSAPLTRESLYWHFPGYLRDQTPVTVIRKGDYKLIHFYETEDYELYNLITDISETTNLLPSSDQVIIDLANDMITDMQNHLTDTNAPLLTYRSGGGTVPAPAAVTLTPDGTNSPDGCQATSGYEAYWDFDTVSGANDASGNGHDPISVSGTLTYDLVDFKEGDQAIVFDGTVEIEYSLAPFLNDATTARTFMGWIKPTALSGTQEIFEEGGTGNGLALRLNGSNIETAMTSITETEVSMSTAYPSDGDWHHVGLVYDGANTSLIIYIDGVLANSTSSALTILNSHASPGGIGGVITNDAFNSGTNDSNFIGKMDALAVYNSALSASQIFDAACQTIQNPTDGCQADASFEAYWDFDSTNATIGDDASGNNHNPVATTGTVTADIVDFKEGDQSAIFDGSSSIQYNNNPFMYAATSVRSVMAWIKPTSLSGIQDIFDEGGNTAGIAIRLNGSSLESIVKSSSSLSQLKVAFPNDGVWHHIAFIYDGTNHTLYIDGIEVATDNAAPSAVLLHTGKGGIGGKLSGVDSFGNAADAYFTGKMDAFAVYNSVLSIAQVEASSCNPVLNIDSNILTNDIGLVYPNPFKDQINIKISGNYTKAEIKIVTILGQVIYTKTFQDKNIIEIPMQQLAEGHYFIKMTIDNQVSIKRIIKKGK